MCQEVLLRQLRPPNLPLRPLNLPRIHTSHQKLPPQNNTKEWNFLIGIKSPLIRFLHSISFLGFVEYVFKAINALDSHEKAYVFHMGSSSDLDTHIF